MASTRAYKLGQRRSNSHNHRSPRHEAQPRRIEPMCVVAVDFGTTFTGYAFTFFAGKEKIILNNNWGCQAGLESYRHQHVFQQSLTKMTTIHSISSALMPKIIMGLIKLERTHSR